MADTPRVLAAFVQMHLQVITGRSPALAKHLREVVDPGVLKEIETASRISWVPLEHHVTLTECTYGAGDRPLASEICRLTVLESFDQPFLKPLFRGALAVLGPSLDRFARWTPKAWYTLFRDVGPLSWIPGEPGSGSLRIASPNRQILDSPDYIEGLASAFSAFFEVTRSTGTIRTQASDEALVFAFTWTLKP